MSGGICYFFYAVSIVVLWFGAVCDGSCSGGVVGACSVMPEALENWYDYGKLPLHLVDAYLQ